MSVCGCTKKYNNIVLSECACFFVTCFYGCLMNAALVKKIFLWLLPYKNEFMDKYNSYKCIKNYALNLISRYFHTINKNKIWPFNKSRLLFSYYWLWSLCICISRKLEFCCCGSKHNLNKFLDSYLLFHCWCSLLLR